MANLITVGVSYTQLLDDIRIIVAQTLTPTPTVPAEVGGIAMAQEITGLSKQRIYNLVSERGIPHSKRGNRLYFNRNELSAWISRGSRSMKEMAYV